MKFPAKGPIVFGLLLVAGAIATANSGTAVETRCRFPAEALTELEEALNGQIAWLEANILRLGQNNTGIESRITRGLVSHHQALLAEARDAQRTLAEESEKLKSASALPATTCRKPPKEK